MPALDSSLNTAFDYQTLDDSATEDHAGLSQQKSLRSESGGANLCELNSQS